MTATTNMLVCELGEVLGVFSSRENSAGSVARNCDAWESLGNRKLRIDSFDDSDHREVIYDPPSDGDGADNDFEYATCP